jgi:rhamnosyltransferase
LLDQDTEFPEGALNRYAEAVSNYPHDKLFAPIMMANEKIIISPCRFKFMRGFSLNNITPGVSSLQNLSVINCGMCIRTDAFENNNGYNPAIKLDFSDHDFISRFKKVNGERFIVIDMKVQHQLSTTEKNSAESDLLRFGYYLQGERNMTASAYQRAFLKTNAVIRAAKLSFIHLNLRFILKLFK